MPFSVEPWRKKKFSLPTCILENSGSQKLLGVAIDRKLNFNEHVTYLCDKASRKIQALARPFPYISQTQTTFNECQFYATSRTLNNHTQWIAQKSI